MDELVSIVTPTFNSGNYIVNTIEAILVQTYQNWELIIIDDCSVDDSVTKIKRYCERDTRVKLICLRENSGSAVKPRNVGIDNAKGRFIAFCDSDDTWLPNKLELQLNHLVSNMYSFSYTNYSIVDEDYKYISHFNSPKTLTYQKLLTNNYIGCSTVMYDTKIIEKKYFPEIKIGEDWAVWIDILKQEKKVYCLDCYLTKYMKRKKSISSFSIFSIKYIWILYNEILNYNVLKSIFYFTIYFFVYTFKKIRLGV